MWNTNLYPEHLYIHWPFCKNKCHYCDFVAFEGHNGFEARYHSALCSEILEFSQSFANNSKMPIKTIFFGGGTPSIYPLELMADLFSLLRKNFILDEMKEMTLEVNPGDISEDKLRMWKDFGINRLSIGLQVLDDDVLKKLNRHQTKADADELLALAPKYFDNISVDLILGLPGVSYQKWNETLNYVVSSPLKHVSVYFLTVHQQTPLYFKIKKGELKIPEDETYINLYGETVQFLEQHGFMQYEISNFAKNGFESIHNKAYWDRKPYKGFGLGAASFDGKNRFVNLKNLMSYLKNIDLGIKNFLLNKEEITAEQLKLESLMLNLRQKKGVDLHSVLYYEDVTKKTVVENKIKMLIEHSLIEIYNGNLRLTLKGMALENEVIMSLL